MKPSPRSRRRTPSSPWRRSSSCRRWIRRRRRRCATRRGGRPPRRGLADGAGAAVRGGRAPDRRPRLRRRLAGPGAGRRAAGCARVAGGERDPPLPLPGARGRGLRAGERDASSTRAPRRGRRGWRARSRHRPRAGRAAGDPRVRGAAARRGRPCRVLEGRGRRRGGGGGRRRGGDPRASSRSRSVAVDAVRGRAGPHAARLPQDRAHAGALPAPAGMASSGRSDCLVRPHVRRGRFLGLPYDWRADRWPPARRALEPAERRILVPKAFGWGYGINLACALSPRFT